MVGHARQDPLTASQAGNPRRVRGVVPGRALGVGEPPLVVVAPVVDGERGGVVEEARVNLGVVRAVEVVAVDSAHVWVDVPVGLGGEELDALRGALHHARRRPVLGFLCVGVGRPHLTVGHLVDASDLAGGDVDVEDAGELGGRREGRSEHQLANAEEDPGDGRFVPVGVEGGGEGDDIAALVGGQIAFGVSRQRNQVGEPGRRT